MMENTTYSNMEKNAEEAPTNIKHKELETLIIASIASHLSVQSLPGYDLTM